MENFESDISQIIDRSENNTFIAQSYTDIKPLHRSSKGAFELFRANHFGKWVVLKALKDDYRSDPFFETILQKEFRLGHQISHKGIVDTIDFINLPEIGNAIVLEYINGATLREYIEENAPLSIDECKRIVYETLEAVKHLHNNKVIHRDLKPENIMIERNTGSVKIIDLGCADASDYNVIKGPAGTRHYAAPEQLTTGGKIDVRADIYAIGKIILYIVSANNIKWRKAIKIAKKCTEENPTDRYSSVVELLRALNMTPKRQNIIFAAAAIITIIIASVIIFRREQVAPVSTPISTQLGNIDTIYIAPTLTNQKIADSIYNSKATIIKEKLDAKHNSTYPQLEHTDNINDKAKYIAPIRTNQEIADSIYNSKAIIIKEELDAKLNVAYTQLEHADNVYDMAEFEPQIDELLPGFLDSTRKELSQYSTEEILESYISNLNKQFYEIRYNYRITHLRTHLKNLFYNLGDSAGFKTFDELFLTKQGYK